MARKVYVEVTADLILMATSHRCQLNGKTERYMRSTRLLTKEEPQALKLAA